MPVVIMDKEYTKEELEKEKKKNSKIGKIAREADALLREYKKGRKLV